MSENPTYRVTGEDWDSPAPERLVVPPRVPPATTPPAPQTIAAPRLASPAAAGSAAAAPGASLASGWATATPVGTPAGAAPVVDRPAFPSGVSRRLGRLPPPIGPALERVPPRMLLGGGGLAVAAVVIVIFASARPNGVAAIATTTPTEIAPVATVSCETPTAPLPLPDLVVRSIHGEEHHLTGFAAPDAELDLDGPWPAVLGPSEASVELGSTLRLAGTGACIAEWRAIAARPPETIGKPWRPDGPDAQQLGWQHADRVGWQPSIPLPPRGEWIVRLTVWYRDAAGATAPTLAPASSGAGSGDGSPWVVERYFRIVVEARDS